jgi:hypothetical protein
MGTWKQREWRLPKFLKRESMKSILVPVSWLEDVRHFWVEKMEFFGILCPTTSMYLHWKALSSCVSEAFGLGLS